MFVVTVRHFTTIDSQKPMKTKLLNSDLLNIKAPGLLLAVLLLCFNISMATPTASFISNQQIGCTPLNVQFTSTSTGAVSYRWDLGNGNSSTLANPANLYTTPGSYTVKLIAYDGSGNADSVVMVNYITVVGKPTADFNSPNLASCLDGNSFTFNNTSVGASTYLWDFGDGSTSTLANPTHSYSMQGTFTVTLIATSAFGCQDVKIKNQYITIYPKPNSAVTAAVTASCDPATVFQFSNNAANATSWFWTFGDATFSTAQNPSHTFAGPGLYNVQVIVTNSFGCKDTTDTPTEISVGLNNWANFSTDIDSGCAPLIVQFTNTNANVASSYWDFGDGTTSTLPSPSHTYAVGGNYSVFLIVTTNSGCADTVFKSNLIEVGTKPSVSFSYVNTVGCSPLTVQFTNTSTNFVSCLWTFGDGTTSTATNPSHTYTNNGVFSVILKCWGPTGCTRSMIYHDIITVTSSEAIFNASPRVGCPPLTTTFNSLSPVQGLNYLWDFGDGTTSTQANPSHTYTTSGNFDVSLIIVDSLGCRDTLTKTNYIQTVNPAANYVPPTTTVGCGPLTTQFTDATAGANSWLWDFGDGTTSTSQNPVHSYTVPGFYTVSLTTTSAAGGCSQQINNFSSFEVQGGYAGFTHTTTPCPPYIATFQDTSLNAVSWLWDFGDGTTSTLQNPDHTYTVGGYHSVSLTITTADGCSYTTMQSNSVYFSPFGANFYGIPQDTVFPNPVQFYANSIGATSWLWDFGDGSTSTLANPLHVFQNPGNYNVTLTISNGVCTLFYDPPPFDFGTPDLTPIDGGNPGDPVVQRGCAPLNVQFTNMVPGSVTWLWDFGDGQSSTEQFPSHLYNSPGIYNVSLTVSDTLGIVQTLLMDSIVRVSGPTAGFYIIQNTSCTGSQISLVDTSRNAATWNWQLGDGTSSNVQNPVHSYPTSTPNYIITQTVTDTMGCSSSISRSIYSNFISPLLASETEICGLDTVHFFTSLQNYASYLWDFGDGTTGTQPTPSHVYTTEGVFNVTLTVTDNAGCQQTFTVNPPITVNLPVASFTTTTGRAGCNQINIQYVNNSQNAQMYLWDFGDGNISSLEEPMHTYTDAGVYDVSLTVYSGSCISRQVEPQYVRVDTAHADFVYTTDQICIPIGATFTDLSANAVSWQWYFGDGDSSNVQNPFHSYQTRPTLYPMLVITDIHGCVDTARSNSFSNLRADFTTSVDSGCFPMTIQFTNASSLIADNFYWSFGDGTTSTDPSPTHTYAQPGVYDVQLVISSIWASCTDTLNRPALIKVRQPSANFSSTDLTACAPSVVNFTDLCVDADMYLWDFGDGTTSTNSNPSHIYNTPGNYTVSLIAQSNLGCSDTIVRQEYIQVRGPVTNFSASALTGCSPFTVNFTDLSTNASSWNWNFGDGNSVTTENSSHVFPDSGTYTISLVTWDTTGCSSYYQLPQPVTIHPSPTADFTSPSLTGCAPFTGSFTNLSTGYNSNLWIFGDGSTSTSTDVTHTYNQSGTFDVKLITYNSYGCTDTARMQSPVEVLATPSINFSASANAGCSPLNVNFINSTSGTAGATYNWDFGNGQTSSDVNPLVVFTQPGFYNVSLTVTNSNGCGQSRNFPALIHVYDTLPPNESRIYSVSVVDDHKVEIIWENNPAIDLAAYVLYRKDDYSSTYNAIYTQTNVQNTNFDLTSSYIDSGLTTLTKTYTYKVQAIDICGYTIPLDQLTAHTTVNISSQRSAAGTGIDVNWTAYSGCPVSTYQLYRSAPGEPFMYIATVPGDSLSYVDSTFICPVPYRYKVIATDLCGTTYTSWSDTSQTYPLNTLENQVVDVVRSTVVDNQTVLTEWTQPLVHPEMVAQFDIYRSTDNRNFRYLTSVPSVQTDFMDYDVDVQNINYYYKILVINTCSIDEGLSGHTSTIVLKGDMDEFRQVHLNWTPYKGWAQGVDYYILEKLDENGHWQLLKQVDGETYRYDYQE